MFYPSMTMLYVKNSLESAVFYERLFETPPVEKLDNFALFVLENGFKLGLWATHDVVPRYETPAGSAELCFMLPSREEVSQAHDGWAHKCLPIIQAPTAMDFGYTFTALDPDGHRLRVYVLEEA